MKADRPEQPGEDSDNIDIELDIESFGVGDGVVIPTTTFRLQQQPARAGSPDDHRVTISEQLDVILQEAADAIARGTVLGDWEKIDTKGKIEQLIASRISALENEASVKPVYPETMEYVRMVKSAHDNGKYDDMYENGWKACDDQWRALLAEKRKELK